MDSKKSNSVSNSRTLCLHFVKDRWILILMVLLFILIKIPNLGFPYYWDESWPYVPSLFEMYKHGASLLPNALQPDFSRGHPLLFHSSAALWMDVFGVSRWSLHSFALTIAVFCLVSIYEICNDIFSKRVAILSLLLVALHESFFVQSTFLLPEVMLAWLSLMSLYFYIKEKFWLTTLFITATFLTKESGLIIGFVIGMDVLFSFFISSATIIHKIKRAIPVFIAVAIDLGFFVLQKKYNGWYLFPLHNKSILTDWKDIWYQFRMCSMRTMMALGHEYLVFLSLIGTSIFLLYKYKSRYFFLFLCLVALFCFGFVYTDNIRYCSFERRTHLNSYFCFIAFVITFFTTIYYIYKSDLLKSSIQSRFFVLLSIFIFCFMFFSASVFYTARYLLSSEVPFMIFTAVLFDIVFRKTYTFLIYPVIVIIIAATLVTYSLQKKWGDTDFGYLNALKVQDDVVIFMEKNNLYDSAVSTRCFLEKTHLINPNSGFLKSGKNFSNVNSEIKMDTRYVIFDNIEPDENFENFLNDTSFRLIQNIEHGNAWAKIFIRK